MILLDNDVLRKARDANPDPAVLSYLERHRDDPWLVSAIVLYEYLTYYGSDGTRRQQRYELKRMLNRVVPFDEETAAEAADIENSLDAVGTSLDVADLLIAATAREHGATLATANADDFDKEPIRQLLDVDIVDTA